MKLVHSIFILVLFSFLLFGCEQSEEQPSVKPKQISILSSSIYENYVYKEKTKLIVTQQEAEEVSKFFETNLHKEDILQSYLTTSFFDQYALITGYVNASYLDKEIGLIDLSKSNNNVYVVLSSRFCESEYTALDDFTNLTYYYFIIKVNKKDIPTDPIINVKFENNLSTYQPLSQLSCDNNIPFLNVHEFNNYTYSEKIGLIDTPEKLNNVKEYMVNTYDNSTIFSFYDSNYFTNNALILASYTYSSYEKIVSIMGLNKENQTLNIIVSSNVPTNPDSMFIEAKQKLFIIEIEKQSVQGISTYAFQNYNLFNGNSKSIYNNQNMTATVQEVTYNKVDVYDNISSPIFLYNIDSLNKLSTIKSTLKQLDHDNSYLDSNDYTEDFFENNMLIVLSLSYPSSDGNVGIYKLLSHGSYLEVSTSSINSSDGDQSWDIKKRIFVIRIEKQKLDNITAFSHSIKYLGD